MEGGRCSAARESHCAQAAAQCAREQCPQDAAARGQVRGRNLRSNDGGFAGLSECGLPIGAGTATAVSGGGRGGGRAAATGPAGLVCPCSAACSSRMREPTLPLGEAIARKNVPEPGVNHRSTNATRLDSPASYKPPTAAVPQSGARARNEALMQAAKRAAGFAAVDRHVASGMLVGLGTGSTAAFAVERVAQKLSSGELRGVRCVPTSVATHDQAAVLQIPLTSLDELAKGQMLDVAIDGADAVDPDLCLIKGGGGALLREKMVEVMAKKFICIVDESKLCPGLGRSFPLPVEITPFSHEHTMRVLAALPELRGCRPVLRRGDCSNNKEEPGKPPAVTDNGNYIVDLHFDSGDIPDASRAARAIKNTVGVVEHGLFCSMVYQTIIAYKDGSCRVAGLHDGAERPWWGTQKLVRSDAPADRLHSKL